MTASKHRRRWLSVFIVADSFIEIGRTDQRVVGSSMESEEADSFAVGAAAAAAAGEGRCPYRYEP